MTEHVTLSRKELDRLQMMIRIAEKRLTRTRAAELLGMSECKVRQLYAMYLARGAAGVSIPRQSRGLYSMSRQRRPKTRAAHERHHGRVQYIVSRHHRCIEFGALRWVIDLATRRSLRSDHA